MIRFAGLLLSFLKRRQPLPLDDPGLWGEAVAARSLQAEGFRILGRRVRVGRRDEIDIIARDGDEIVFVEVKTRRNEDYGRPVSAINKAKRAALSRAAVRYLKNKRHTDVYFRFDAVEVIGEMGGAAPVIRHIRNVFQAGDKYLFP